MSRAAALAIPVWVDARERNDFAAFLPALRENLELERRYIECFDGDFDEPYDALLDDYEPGMKTAEVRDALRLPQGAPGAARRKLVARRGPAAVDAGRRFPLELQKVFELEVVAAVRLRRRVAGGSTRPCIRSQAARRDAGHPDHDALLRGQPRRPVRDDARVRATGSTSTRSTCCSSARRSARGVSLGMHESQSRMWENLVGRSLPFWRFFFPRLAGALPARRSAGYDVERWYREINAVEPSLIRVEADEATYNLHIILRFELEQELLAGSVPLEQLPEEWNRRMWEYLGIEVPDDTRGVLQDTHWAIGAIGYFPTYALGNLISAQLWERIARRPARARGRASSAASSGRCASGSASTLHRHGRKFTPAETLERAIGAKAIDPEPYVRYLQRKIGAIYGLPRRFRLTVLAATFRRPV